MTQQAFFIDFKGMIFSVYKIKGDSVQKIAGRLGYVYNAFVINAFTIYEASQYYSDQIDLYRSSDMNGTKQLIADTSFMAKRII